MAIDSDIVEITFLDIVQDVPIGVDMKTYDTSHITIMYGTAELDTDQGIDYLIELNEDGGYEDFTITPQLSLIDKINDLIASVPTEVNKILVRRQVPYLSDLLDTDSFLRAKIARQFDLVEMQMQQLAHDFALYVDLSDALTQAQAAAAAAEADRVIADAKAAEAVAAAASVDAANILHKYDNFAGLTNLITARANIGLGTNQAIVAGANRLAPGVAVFITNMDLARDSGWYHTQPGATGAPEATAYYMIEVTGYGSTWTKQVAHAFTQASGNRADLVTSYIRYSWDNSGVGTWTPWVPLAAPRTGELVIVYGNTPKPGTIKANGALLSRTTYAALWAYAQASGNLHTEATWSGGQWGGFSTGDGSTSFRIPALRGEFVRAWDDSAGVDSGRVVGSRQVDALKDHTHNYTQPIPISVLQPGGSAGSVSTGTTATGGVNNPNNGGAETRPRNVALLHCIGY